MKKYCSYNDIIIISIFLVIIFIAYLFFYLSLINKDNLSLGYFYKNKMLALKWNNPNHSLPNFVKENKKEEEKTFKLPNPLPQPPKQENVPILMFHHIANIPQNEPYLQKGLTIGINDFDQELAYLKSKGYEAITMSDLLRALYKGGRLPAKPVVFTFDDGYDNAYSAAFPLLKKYNYKGSFYLITDAVGQPTRITWPQVKEMANAGMEFGSHSKNHPDLSQLDLQAINTELSESKKAIEKEINKNVYFFCYPAGKYKTEIFSALKNQGYLLALTTNPGASENSNNPFELPRVRIWGGITLNEFKTLMP